MNGKGKTAGRRVRTVTVVPLEATDRERFVRDNQEAFNYGATVEFGPRDDHSEHQRDPKVVYNAQKGRYYIFLGAQTNPYAVMDRMDAFLSTSRYEGQPLNIEEARVIGLPIYCSKNLEAYSEGLHGLEEEDLKAAILAARKGRKQPDDLVEYNRRILESIYDLA